MLLYYPDANGGQFQLKQNSMWEQFLSFFGIGQQTSDSRTTTASPAEPTATEPSGNLNNHNLNINKFVFLKLYFLTM